MNLVPSAIDRPVRSVSSAMAFFLLPIAIPLPAWAHHSFAAEYDPNLVGTISGEVVEVRFVNPHVRYRLRTRLDDGSAEEWEIQTHNVGTMRRMDWDADTVQVGDRIEVTGAMGRNGARKLSMDTVILADGSRRAPRGGEFGAAYADTEVNADPSKSYGITPNTDYPIDITGFWTNRYKFRLTVDDLEPKPTPFTAAGRRLYAATEPWQDPSKRCAASGLPRNFGAPVSMQILDAGTHYLMILGGGVRRIWMDGRRASADVLPSPMGFARGRWEGDELVIETTHLLPGWLDGSGLPMSGDGTRLVERYTFSDDRLSIDRVMTIHDPYYTAPLIRRRGSARSDNPEAAEGGSSCDSISHYRDLAEQGLLESLWEPAPQRHAD